MQLTLPILHCKSAEGRFLSLQPCGGLIQGLALQLYHLLSTAVTDELYTIIYSFSLCQKIIFHKVSGIFQRANQQFFAGLCWHFLSTQLEDFPSHTTEYSGHFCTNMKGWKKKKKKKKGISVMSFWTTWSILLDSRFKELETTCTKLSRTGIKETQTRCFCPTESILLQHSDNTPMLSLSDCTEKVSKALVVLMGTHLQRTSCETHACAQLRRLIIITCPLKRCNPSLRSKFPPEFSADPPQSVKFYFLVKPSRWKLADCDSYTAELLV